MAGILDFLNSPFKASREKDKLANDLAREKVTAARNLNTNLGLLAPIHAGDPRTGVNPITGELMSPDIGNLASARQQQQADLPGILAQIAPAQAAQAAFAPPPTRRGVLGILDAQGLDPTNENIAKASAAMNAGSFDPREGALLDFKLAEAARTLREGTTDDSDAVRIEKQGVLDTFGTVKELQGLLPILEGSFVEPGTGSEARRFLAGVGSGIENLTGADFGAGEQATAFDQYVKGASRLLNQQIQRTIDAGGTVTNAQRDLQRRAAANEGITLGAASKIFEDELKRVRREAKRLNVELPDVGGDKPASTPTSNNFTSEDEIQSAIDAGDVKIGDSVLLNGETIVLDPQPSALDQAGSQLSDFIDSTVQAGSEAANAFVPAVSDFAASAAQTGQQAVDAAAPVANNLLAGAQQAGQQAQDFLSNAGQQAQGVGQGAFNTARQAINTAAPVVQESASNLTQQGTALITDTLGKMEQAGFNVDNLKAQLASGEADLQAITQQLLNAVDNAQIQLPNRETFDTLLQLFEGEQPRSTRRSRRRARRDG